MYGQIFLEQILDEVRADDLRLYEEKCQKMDKSLKEEFEAKGIENMDAVVEARIQESKRNTEIALAGAPRRRTVSSETILPESEKEELSSEQMFKNFLDKIKK